MIVVDTSIWIDFFRRKLIELTEFDDLFARRELTAPSFVFGELLQGARDAAERKVLLRVWEALPRVDEERVWLDAGTLAAASKAHAKGVGLIDVGIVVVGRRHKAKIWTLDKKLRAFLEPQERFVL